MRLKSVLTFATAALALSAFPFAANASTTLDGSFETQGSGATFYSSPGTSVGGGDGYCYFGLATLDCNNNTPWSGSGLINPLSAFGQPASAQDGDYYSFVQGSQNLTRQFTSTVAGISNLSLWTAGRTNNGGVQTVSIFLNGSNVGNFTTSQSTPTWFERSFAVNLVNGLNQIEFRGQTRNDQTAFIDNISIGAVPEPSTWAMLVLGFGLIGFALRRSQAASTRVSFA